LFSGGDDIFFSRESMEVLLVGADFTLLARPFDRRILPTLKKESEAARVGNFLGSTAGDLSAIGAVWGLGLVSRNEKLRYHAGGFTKAAAYTAVLTKAFKVAIDRDRPNSESEGSFPSGHTSGAFTAASYFDTAYGHRVGIPLYGLAAFIGYSRLAQEKHYFSDVVAGATLGVIVGKAMGKHHKNKWERKSHLHGRR
jgi:membrane-associated phospholipid phosphatase